QAWLNEKLAPELLEAKSELIECMADQIKEMEENIQRAKKGDIRISIHRMEIEKFTTSILEKEKQRSEEENSHLTPEEFTFAQEYEDSQEGHFRNLVLRHMPPNLQGMDPKQTAVTPNLDQYVFLRVNEDTDGVLVEEETLDQGHSIRRPFVSYELKKILTIISTALTIEHQIEHRRTSSKPEMGTGSREEKASPVGWPYPPSMFTHQIENNI
ncbi:hypothetical protein FSP39_006984, partial [Pinctada imbricata]